MKRFDSPITRKPFLFAAIASVACLPQPAWPANGPSPKLQAALQGINQCVASQQAGACYDRVTASSAELYGKLADYGLMRCVPSDLSYVSQARQGEHVFIRASTRSLGEQKRYVRLGFVVEEGQWKLDAPESLRRALGDKWRQQVDVTEQLYLALRTRFGDKVGCESLQALLR